MKTEVEFWEKVDQSGGPMACWPWEGAEETYGQVYWKGRCRGTHVVAFSLANGRFPEPGMHVMHTCDHRPCCNPAHLSEGTPSENNEDMSQKGRSRAGEHLRARTHCPQGHEYTEENTRQTHAGRWCRQCDRDRRKAGTPWMERNNARRREQRRKRMAS